MDIITIIALILALIISVISIVMYVIESHVFNTVTLINATLTDWRIALINNIYIFDKVTFYSYNCDVRLADLEELSGKVMYIYCMLIKGKGASAHKYIKLLNEYHHEIQKYIADNDVHEVYNMAKKEAFGRYKRKCQKDYVEGDEIEANNVNESQFIIPVRRRNDCDEDD